MSDDVFVKMYLGYSPPLTRFNDRHPSEWIRPRKKHGACLSVIIFCQGASSIRRRCFRPGPCCGKTHGQCCQYDEISTHPALCRTPTFPVRCMAPMVLLASWMMDGYRTSRTKSQAQGARQFGATAVTEVKTQEIGIGSLVRDGTAASWAVKRCGSLTQAGTPFASPVADRRSRDPGQRADPLIAESIADQQ